MVEAEQLKIWHGELEARCRFRPGFPVLLRFRVCGFPAHDLPIDQGTVTDLWRVSFVSFFHVFLPLFNLALARRAMNDNYPPTTLQSVFPVADQRFAGNLVCCLRGTCALNRRMPQNPGKVNAFFHRKAHSTKLVLLSVNRLRSMETMEDEREARLFCSFVPVLAPFQPFSSCSATRLSNVLALFRLVERLSCLALLQSYFDSLYDHEHPSCKDVSPERNLQISEAVYQMWSGLPRFVCPSA